MPNVKVITYVFGDGPSDRLTISHLKAIPCIIDFDRARFQEPKNSYLFGHFGLGVFSSKLFQDENEEKSTLNGDSLFDLIKTSPFQDNKINDADDEEEVQAYNSAKKNLERIKSLFMTLKSRAQADKMYTMVDFCKLIVKDIQDNGPIVGFWTEQRLSTIPSDARIVIDVRKIYHNR